MRPNRPTVLEGRIVTTPIAHCREAGTGPSVLCLHSIGSSSAQWRALMEQLAGSYRVVAADLYGEGKSPPCPAGVEFGFEHEMELLAPIVAGLGPVHVVGHSYGGEVALKLALTVPRQIASLVLYEPVPWGLYAEHWPGEPGIQALLSLRASTCALFDQGRQEQAAEAFIDHWSGAGTWAAMPEARRSGALAGIRNVVHKWRHGPGLRVSPDELRSIAAPVLVLQGADTAPPVRGLMAHLREELPAWRFIELPGLGHMGPITHPQAVNPPVQAFLDGLT